MSKQLSEKQEKLRPTIEHQAVTFAVTEPIEIDDINILNASIKAMQECVLKLNPQPEYIIDGNSPFIRKRHKNSSGKNFTSAEIEILTSIPSSSIVKSAKFMSIAQHQYWQNISR
jgi:ribonuclease HII